MDLGDQILAIMEFYDRRTKLVYLVGEELNEKINELLKLANLEMVFDFSMNRRVITCTFSSFDGVHRTSTIRAFASWETGDKIYYELSHYILRFYITHTFPINYLHQ